MKKVIFTIQMIALIAMIPVYLVVELNREPESLRVNDSSSEVVGRSAAKKGDIQPATNPKDGAMTMLMFKINTTN